MVLLTRNWEHWTLGRQVFSSVFAYFAVEYGPCTSQWCPQPVYFGTKGRAVMLQRLEGLASYWQIVVYTCIAILLNELCCTY